MYNVFTELLALSLVTRGEKALFMEENYARVLDKESGSF